MLHAASTALTRQAQAAPEHGFPAVPIRRGQLWRGQRAIPSAAGVLCALFLGLGGSIAHGASAQSSPAVPMAVSAMVPPATALAVPFAAPQGGESKLAQELRYARGLAARFQFLDLAEAVIDSVAAQKLSAEEQEYLALARAQIFGEAARFQSNPEERRKLFQQALEAYEAFLEAHTLSPNLADARKSYVDLGATYGILVEQDLADAAGERATALREQAVERLTKIASYTGDAIRAMGNSASLPEAQRRELAQLMLSRGQILLLLGRLSDEGSFYLSSGESVLEELIFLMGGESGWAINGYILISEIQLVRGDAEDALFTVEHVIDNAIPRDRAAWDNIQKEFSLTRADKDARWSFLEVATPLALRCAAALGRGEDALGFALHYQNTLSREGFNPSPRGYLTHLEVARTLLENGGVLGGSPAQGTLRWFETLEDAQAAGNTARSIRTAVEQALSIATQISNDNPRSFLQTQAQRVISEAISMPGVSVSTEVLYQAALGDFNAGEHERAVTAMKRVLASADANDQVLYGGRVYLHIGRALQRQGRTLEAAMAFEEAALRYRQDEESASLAAQEFYRTISSVRRKLPGDATVEAIALEAERVAAETGSSDAGEIYLRQAQREADQGRYAEARALFQQVPPDSRVRELATVRAAVATYSGGDLAAARAELTAYLEDFVVDPRNRLGPQDGARLDRRRAAMAEAAYYLGRIALDERKWDEVLARLSNFGQEHTGQSELVAAALDHCASAELERGNLDAARGFLARLETEHEGNPRTARVATFLYNAMVTRHEAARAGGDAAQTRELKRQMAELLSVSNRVSSRPQFAGLRDEGLFWLELGESTRAEAALQRCVREFGSDTRVARELDRIVRPALGRALLLERRAADALAVLAPLVPRANDRESPRPSSDTAQAFVHAVAGWIEGDSADPVIVPGVGGRELLESAREWQSLISSGRESWSCDWFASEVQTIWIMIQIGRLDSQRMESAQRALTSLAAQTGQDFALVRERCGGDPTLQRRLQWLQRQIR